MGLAVAVDTNTMVSKLTDIIQQWKLSGLPEESDRVDAVQQVMQEISSEVGSWAVYVPLTNLRLVDLDYFDFGDIRIWRNDLVESKLLTRMEASISKSNRPEDEKAASVDAIRMVLSSFGASPSVAEAKVIAGGERAEQLAKAEVQATINVLRCYMPMVAPLSHRMWFGITGTVHSSRLVIPRLSEDGESFTLNDSSIGYLHEFSLTQALVEAMTSQLSLDGASALAKLDVTRRTALQTSLIAASQLIGNGIFATSDEVSVILAAMGLELLLGDVCPSERTDRMHIVARAILADTDGQRLVQGFEITRSIRDMLEN